MKALYILILALISTPFFAQDYQSQFQKYFQEEDTLKQHEVLEKWKIASPNDAELYTSLFNYYFSKSRNEILIVAGGETPAGTQAIEFKGRTDKVAGYIGSHIDYESSNLKKGIESINIGISLYPNRLDMRFGKIYVLGQIKDWSSFTQEIITTINYSAVNNNQWTWTNNEKQENGKEFFLSSLQDYQMDLYNTMDDSLLTNMQEIAKTVLKHYPDHIESLSNLSIGYLVSKEYDKALIPLLKAEKINPTDYIVISNIAYAYKEKGDNPKAIEYYSKLIQHCPPQVKQQAEEVLKQLQN